jgi:hypothetical protein
MPSVSLHDWRTVRRASPNQLEAAHRCLGGTERGRRRAIEQINQAYAVLLSSQFQGFCRDLHSECAEYMVEEVPIGLLRNTLHKALVENRKLDRGNPNPGNIGSDFDRFGVAFWTEVIGLDLRNRVRQNRLAELNSWRNAIAHQDSILLGTMVLRLQMVRRWRNACNQLAVCFDEVMSSHLHVVNGVAPW